ncbi:MAG: LysR family transcriptional regulator [Negativicutes bacterium]|nr:LysR family transcriptional regulator [Negativicutes bacterium]
MNDRDWLILQSLYHHKNITRTAQALFLSQPSLTAHLRQIEDEFGVTIVERTKKGVQFTPQGEYLVKCADEMLRKVRSIKEDVANMSNDVIGTLRLGASNYFTKYTLPGLLQLFKAQYPKVDFKAIAGASKDIVTMIYNKDIHIGFVRGDYAWGDRKCLLYEEPVCIVSREEIDLKELPRCPRIEYRNEMLARIMLDNWWREHYSDPPTVVMEVDNVDTCREMVRNGLGYALMTRMIVNEDDLFKINIVSKSGKPVTRKTWMFYHEDSLKMPLVKAFIDLVEGQDLQHTL